MGVATVGLLQPKVTNAANGGAVLIGQTNTGGPNSTVLSGSPFAVFGGGSNAALFGGGNALGVLGTASTPDGNGIGVQGIANVGTSVHAFDGTSTSGVGGAFTGKRGALFLRSGIGAVADPNVTAPSGAAGGDVYRGSTNTSVWYKAGTGTNPYRRLADATTAGALTAFAASSRFVNLSNLNGGATAAYQIGGVTVTGNAVPAKARAIIGRIADANPTGGGGGILVSATNPPPAGTGVLAVTAGAPQNSFFFSALDATGKLYVRNTSPSGSVQIIIDIAGYYE